MATYQFHDVVKTVTRIDRRNGKRQVPMKVLALGLCRTGTDCECSFLHGFTELKLMDICSIEAGSEGTGL